MHLFGFGRKKELENAPESLKALEARVKGAEEQLVELAKAVREHELEMNNLYDKTKHALARLAGRMPKSSSVDQGGNGDPAPASDPLADAREKFRRLHGRG